LDNIFNFCLPKICEAVDAYHEKNLQSGFSKENTISVLWNPVYCRDETHYYDVLSEIFMLDGKPLGEGIHDVVKEYYTKMVVQQHTGSAEAMSLAWNNDYYLSPNSV
jgi:hypothetical protein